MSDGKIPTSVKLQPTPTENASLWHSFRKVVESDIPVVGQLAWDMWGKDLHICDGCQAYTCQPERFAQDICSGKESAN